MIVAPSSISSCLRVVFTSDFLDFKAEGKASGDVWVTTFSLLNWFDGYCFLQIEQVRCCWCEMESSKLPQEVQKIRDPTADIL